MIAREIPVKLTEDELKEVIAAMEDYANIFGQSLDDAPEVYYKK